MSQPIASDATQLAVNALRILSIDAVEAAHSGHPGLPLGAAPIAYALWSKALSFDPEHPHWLNRDRFILSAGHGSALLYSLLHLFEFGISSQDLQQFRQLGSLTPGHPEYGHTSGVEATTGPLGQGFAMAVGLALAEAHLASRFNREGHELFDHYTYTLVGDGCLMEGVSAEAASFAGTHGLGRLIALYDDNEISIDGSTDLSFKEDVPARFAAYGWQVLEVADANDVSGIQAAIAQAQAESQKPSLIVVHSTIGYASPLAGQAKTHGSPLGAENIRLTRQALGWPSEVAFEVPSEVYDHYHKLVEAKQGTYQAWLQKLAAYRQAFPEEYKELQLVCSLNEAGEVQATTAARAQKELSPSFGHFEGSMATRKCSQRCIQDLAASYPQFLGGSADLAGSNLTTIEGEDFLSAQDYRGRNIHFGVREFAMAAISNGLALYASLRPYCATFMVFSDYLKAAIRLSALMQVPVIYILTHDSIGVGEDGPTHQPIEQLSMLRNLPGCYLFRPADGVECAAAYQWALKQQQPVALALSRQNLPTLSESCFEQVQYGAYIAADDEAGREPELILMASGSELAPSLEVRAKLAAEGHAVRVLSVPSLDLFLAQDKAYREKVLPSNCRKRIAFEAAVTSDWYQLVGLDGRVLGLDRFGLSAPAEKVFQQLGLDAEHLEALCREVLA